MELIIEPSRTWSLNIRELWQYRELFYYFTWRDISVKYKQTVLGVLWVVLQPVLNVAIYSLFFNIALHVPSDGMPYTVFVFSGLILWVVFSSGIANAGNSMVSNAQIIKKIYFPRLIIPISAVLVALFDFFVTFPMFLIVAVLYHAEINVWQALILWPASILLTAVGTLGLSSWLAALNVKYRDFRYLIPFFVQALLFLTPVIYPVSILKMNWAKYVLALNPMYGPITLFRLPLIPSSPDWQLVELSVGSSLLLLLTGIFYFRKTEAYFADLA